MSMNSGGTPLATSMALQNSASGSLTFSTLESLVASYAPPVPLMGESGPERLALTSTVVGLAIALVALLFPRSTIRDVSVGVGVVLECLGVAWTIFAQSRAAWASISRQHTDQAESMDADFPRFRGLLRALAAEDRRHLQSMREYLDGLHDRMGRRIGFVTGGVERLGIVPVLIALYFQVSNLSGIDWVQAMIAFLLVLAYIIGLFAVRSHSRVELYRLVLKHAVESENREG